MGDLVFFLDQVQFFFDGRIVLILVFPNLEKDLDHILHPFVDISLVQYAPKLVKDC
jgi:hypothetical protein